MTRPDADMSGETQSPAPRTAASPELGFGERWFVVQTRARDEHRAQLHLSQQSFRTFLPTVVRTVRHARKVRNVQAAVFPGYLFVVLDLARDRFRSINGTRGVVRLVTCEAAPVPVPRGVVETLLDYRDATGACRFDRDLLEGQRVRIISGPLASVVGKLTRLDANGRVEILLELLNGSVHGTLNRSALEAA